MLAKLGLRASFESRLSAAQVKSNLEIRLRAYAGKPIGVVVRTASEMQAKGRISS
jgi:hypothetical protein